MNIHLFYAKAYDKIIRKYDERNFKRFPEHIAGLLKSAEDYEIGRFSYEGHDHVELCQQLEKLNSSPFSFILFQDFLDESHWDDENYQHIEEVSLISELDERVARLFGSEINKRQMEFLDSIKNEKNQNLQDELAKRNLQTIYESHYPEALEIIMEEYKSWYRGFWKKKFDDKRIREPKKGRQYTRILNLPKPVSVFNELSFEQQIYFVPEEKIFVMGRGSGSYTRYIHSLFGFAFALYQQRNKSVPTHLFVYDKHNELKFIDSLKSLCLLTGSLGSNYNYTKETREKLLEKVLLCRTADFFGR